MGAGGLATALGFDYEADDTEPDRKSLYTCGSGDQLTCPLCQAAGEGDEQDSEDRENCRVDVAEVIHCQQSSDLNHAVADGRPARKTGKSPDAKRYADGGDDQQNPGDGLADPARVVPVRFRPSQSAFIASMDRQYVSNQVVCAIINLRHLSGRQRVPELRAGAQKASDLGVVEVGAQADWVSLQNAHWVTASPRWRL